MVGRERVLARGAREGGVDVRDEDLLPGGDGEERADGEGEGARVEVVGRVGGAAGEDVVGN